MTVTEDKFKDKNQNTDSKLKNNNLNISKSVESDENKLIQELEAFSNGEKFRNLNNKGMLKGYLNKNSKSSKDYSILKSENSFIKESNQLLDNSNKLKLT